MKEILLAKLKNQFGESVTNVEEFRGELCLWVDENRIVEIAAFLKKSDVSTQ